MRRALFGVLAVAAAVLAGTMESQPSNQTAARIHGYTSNPTTCGVGQIWGRTDLALVYWCPTANTPTLVDSTGAPASFVSTANPKYGLVADAHTLTDGAMTATSATLTDASGTYSSADVGKLIVVNGAGANAVSTTLTSTLSTGGPITSIAVSALGAALPGGWVTLTSGGNTQIFTTPGANSGATSITVDSQTPNFAYPASTTTVISPPLPLSTTIASVQSATQVTTTVAASNTVSSAEVVYGTNNLTGLNSAVSDASTKQLPLFIAPSGSVGEGYMYSGALVLSSQVSLFGAGETAVFQPTVATQINIPNFPTSPPYLKGSVLIQAATATDAIQITQGRFTGQLHDFGIRFAGEYIPGATGHGVDTIPPTAGSHPDSGVVNALWHDVDVFGTDGNHYCYWMQNTLYDTLVDMRCYGGGNMDFETNGNWEYGNTVVIHPYVAQVVAGTAYGYHVWSSVQYPNKITFVRPQDNAVALNPAITGLVSVRSPQCQFSTTSTANPAQNIAIIAGDFEGNSCYNAATGVVNFTLGTTQNTSATNNPTSGTIYQNTSGSAVLLNMTYTLNPTGVAAATVLFNNCQYSSSCATPFFVDEISAPATAVTGSVGTLHGIILSGAYYKVTITNATYLNGETIAIPQT